jgi:pyruvate formate lyase activating enzyme
MITNGFINQQPLLEILTVIDAMNIDIKSFNPRFYKRLCKGNLIPVLHACVTAKKYCHLEITTLLIPDTNDSDDEICKLAMWIAQNLGKDTPLHVSRYFPHHLLKEPATPVTTMLRAWEIASSFLDYVYVGNVQTSDKENTYCPKCKSLLILRDGYTIKKQTTLLTDGTCGSCGEKQNFTG